MTDLPADARRFCLSFIANKGKEKPQATLAHKEEHNWVLPPCKVFIVFVSQLVAVFCVLRTSGESAKTFV
jgi:hypothetical protein